MENFRRAVIYARYSSHSQRDASIEQQVAACRRFAERQDIEIVEVYEDRATTGTNDRRPGFQKMIKDAERANWEYVIVYTLDRFARDRYASAVYKRKLKDCGIKVLSAMEQISDDPTGILMESLLEGLAEYYSQELSRKVQRGHEDNAQKCMVNGALPLGYVKGPDSKYCISEPEAEIVREIFQRVSADEKLSDIIADMNRRGILTKKKKQWNRSSFNQLLSNERYTGTYIYRDIRIPGGIPQIIPNQLFDAVQLKIYTKPNARKDPSGERPQRRRRDAGTYLLTGKLFCGDCKSPMIGISGTSRDSSLHYYYACKGRRADPNACKRKNIRRDWIEEYICQILRETMLTDEAISVLAEAAVSWQQKQNGSNELDSLKARLIDVDKSLFNLLKAIEAGIFSSTTQSRLLELEQEKQNILRLIQQLELAITDIPTKEEIMATLALFRDGEITDKQYQEALIDTFLVAAYIYNDKIRFIVNLGDKNNHPIEIPFDIDAVDTEDVRISSLVGDHFLLYEHLQSPVWMISGLFVFAKKF